MLKSKLSNLLSNALFNLLSFESALDNSSEERYLELGTKYSSLKPFEEEFNHLIELVGQGQLSSSYSLERLSTFVETLKQILSGSENQVSDLLLLKHDVENVVHLANLSKMNLVELLKLSKLTRNGEQQEFAFLSICCFFSFPL